MTVFENSDNLYHHILEYEQSIAKVLILIECLKNAGQNAFGQLKISRRLCTYVCRYSL